MKGRRHIKDLERDLRRDNAALAETAALLARFADVPPVRIVPSPAQADRAASVGRY